MPRCDDCANRRCSCVIVDGDNTTVLGTGSKTDPYVINSLGAEGDSLWEPGDIKPTGRGAASTGWLLCDGAAVSRATYAALFGAIGVVFGPGDGTTTFNVPDLAGRFPFGADGTHPRGEVSGQEQITLTTANLPPHTHTIAHAHDFSHDHANTVTDAQGNHAHNTDAHHHEVKQSNAAGTNNNTFARGAAQDREVNTTDKSPNTTATGTHQHNVDIPAFGGNTGGSSSANSGSVGSGTPHTNMPPYLAINFVIKT